MKHLFILAPPRSCSNYVTKKLWLHPNIQRLPLDEGQWYFNPELRKRYNIHLGHNEMLGPNTLSYSFSFLTQKKLNRFLVEEDYKWDEIIELWNKEWGKDKPENSDKTFLEKSPANTFIHEFLDKRFENSKFLGMMKNPYAIMVGWSVHFQYKPDEVWKSALDWVKYAHHLKLAIEKYKDRIMYMPCEDLWEDTEGANDRLHQFLPELSSFDFNTPSESASILDRKVKDASPINYNYAKIQSISRQRIDHINRFFRGEIESYEPHNYKPLELLDYFNYKLI